MEKACREREYLDERVKRVRSKSEDSGSLAGLTVGLEKSMWGSSTGPSANSLLGSESWSSGGGTTGHIPCIEKQSNRSEPGRHRLSIGLGRGLCEAYSPSGLGD